MEENVNGFLQKTSWKKEAEKYLKFALNKIQKEYRDVEISTILKQDILERYYIYSVMFGASCTHGFLDSFQKAACLMFTLEKCNVLFKGNNQLKLEFVLESVLKMIEEPIYYDGENYKKLNKFNFEKFKENYPDEWKNISCELMMACYYSSGKWNENEILHKSLILKYLYKYINAKANEINIKENFEANFEIEQESEKVGIVKQKKYRKPEFFSSPGVHEDWA